MPDQPHYADLQPAIAELAKLAGKGGTHLPTRRRAAQLLTHALQEERDDEEEESREIGFKPATSLPPAIGVEVHDGSDEETK